VEKGVGIGRLVGLNECDWYFMSIFLNVKVDGWMGRTDGVEGRRMGWIHQSLLSGDHSYLEMNGWMDGWRNGISLGMALVSVTSTVQNFPPFLPFLTSSIRILVLRMYGM